MMELAVKPNVLWAVGGLYVLLLLASSIVSVLVRLHPERDYGELRRRVKSWWMMIVLFTLAISLSRGLSFVFFGFVSFLALKEYFSLIPTRRANRRVLFWAYLSIPIQYYWIGIGWYGMFIIFIPVYVFLFLPMRMVMIGDTKDFLRSAASLHWGLMMMVFSLSHLSFLLALPESGNPKGGGAGLVLFLTFLTEFNDVAQYVWGKMLGKRKIVPKVSPNKTWAGFLGGVATTLFSAWLMAPWLTPFSVEHALLAGLLIPMAGFIGDVVISAVKRDIGVKDSGNLLPGHGGVLDRIDSLIYTAPLFFHFVHYLYF